MTYLANHPEIIRLVAVLCGLLCVLLALALAAFWLQEAFAAWYEDRHERERTP